MSIRIIMILKLFNFFKYGLVLVILICLKNNLLMLTTDSGVKSHQETIRLGHDSEFSTHM